MRGAGIKRCKVPASGLSLEINGTNRACITSWSLAGAAHPLLSERGRCERRGIPKEQGQKRCSGGHPDVLTEQDQDVLQCGTVLLW